MLRIDNNLLQEVGLGALPDTEKNSLLRHIYETLEMRVGIRLADQMTNEQLDEFERYFEAKDDAGAFKWLETNFPNYKEIVQEEFEKLKGEIAQSAPQILSSSTQGGASQQPAPQQPLPSAQPAGQPASTSYPPQQQVPPQPNLNPQPLAPPPPVPMDVNMPTQPPQFAAPPQSQNNPASPGAYGAGTMGSQPQSQPIPTQPTNHVAYPQAPTPQQIPYPDQQPPAGPTH